MVEHPLLLVQPNKMFPSDQHHASTVDLEDSREYEPDRGGISTTKEVS